MKAPLTGQVILVEGKGDKLFLLGVLAQLGKRNVKPAPPGETGLLGNGVDNVIKYIPNVVAAIMAGEVTQAAIVIDADHGSTNGGFAMRREQIVAKLAGAGYDKRIFGGIGTGEIFAHSAYPAVIGLFILPNHRDDGMLEDLLRHMVIQPPYRQLMQHAQTTVANLEPQLFNPQLHGSKAEVNTFLAWQKSPPAALREAVEQQIFDIGSPECAGLVAWLAKVFG